MAIRQGNRAQMELLPPSIEQYVAEDAPVRVYDAFVEALDLAELGIICDPARKGKTATHHVALCEKTNVTSY